MKSLKYLVPFLVALGGSAQKLETQSADQKKIIRVETATDHLTVIEVGSPVTMVAVGNHGAFTVERRENKVFVKPVEQGARTNLFVWTAAGRFAYELVPATSIEQMHFAIDQTPASVLSKIEQRSEEPGVDAAALPVEMLTRGKPILVYGERETEGRVEVTLRDLYRDSNRLYIRYAVINNTGSGYQSARPGAWQLAGVRSPHSLIPLGGRQLGEKLTRSLKMDNEVRIRVLNADQTPVVPAGGEGIGWLVLETPKAIGDDMAVLRLQFAADTKGAVGAVLVLNRSERPEMSHAPTLRNRGSSRAQR